MITYIQDGDCLNLSAYPRARWVTEDRKSVV